MFVEPQDFGLPDLSGGQRLLFGESAVQRPDIAKHSLVGRLLSGEETSAWRQSLRNAHWQPVSVTGMSGNYSVGDRIGSYRATDLRSDIAAELWQRLAPILRPVYPEPLRPTDHDGSCWEPVAVNPLLRFIRYQAGGALVPHYDAPYVQDEHIRSLQSVVVYLSATDECIGGATRFLVDGQHGVPVGERDLGDGGLDSGTTRVSFQPTCAGQAMIFDHRLWHDGEGVRSGEKYLLRTDVMFRRAA